MGFLYIMVFDFWRLGGTLFIFWGGVADFFYILNEKINLIFKITLLFTKNYYYYMKKGLMEILVIVIFVMILVAVLLYEFTRYGFFSSYIPVIFVLVSIFVIFLMAASYVR